MGVEKDILVPPEHLELDKLDGSITQAEGLRLSFLASLVKPPSVIVEIGSFKGKSSCYLAAGSKMGHNVPIYCIDTWELGPPYDYEDKPYYLNPKSHQKFLEQTKRYSALIHPIQGYATKVAETWDKPVGLYFHDAGHTYREVLDDYNAWKRHLALDAIVAWHDYTARTGEREAIDELKLSSGLIKWKLYNTLISAERQFKDRQ